ncbi:MAG: dihydroorotate dehydrogenase-like protein [Aminobacterium sp.]|jgi:dihydroorotate dehydrogenase (fumarate)|nr:MULTISPECIES: dihydroorotate dehydrogenase-like protein [unclassified Aminobacterium]MDD2206379.1 dihydroorotate dehydrogenase-like protein [Aminobacterium sp.]MDD3426495.1 dihydroorotate dehydrogenase-like protein [Aminobacterium sp.]MDD3707474.1 dihydroorotate dehydrogenase-like protein [Aminobacterium sp.]MDD4228396.1 dihydroorotate dehydrogenase-like protein [Aminobacterium sp.]MDD4552292.1 dihydroorotate dehydrogenase-like protein [Aminobacterium sp.]
MAIDLSTEYMGVELKNPVIVGASGITSNLETIRKAEEAGAGGIVIKSLFEEQIALESLALEHELTDDDERHAEMIALHPGIAHAGPEEHIMWVNKIIKDAHVPVFASLNAGTKSVWVEWAEKLSKTGVQGLELNLYAMPIDKNMSGSQIENEQLATVQEVLRVVSIPVSVKLSPFYTNPLHFVSMLDQMGTKGYVLFNNFINPDINPEEEKEERTIVMSHERDSLLPLRFIALLFGTVNGSLCANRGIFTGEDVAKMLLAGADCVQVVSALYKNGIESIHTMVNDVERWMGKHGYGVLDECRGVLSKMRAKDPYSWERAQYVDILMRNESPFLARPDI